MRRLRFYIAASWRPAAGWLLALCAVSALLFVRLESLTPSYAAIESETVGHLAKRDLGIRNILQQPLYLPYQLGVYLLEKASIDGIYAARALSASMGLLAVGCFHYVISRWHTRRIALLGTLLFATSSWLLHTARLATPEAAFLLLLPLVACGTWLNETNKRGLKPLALAIAVSGLLLYVPGMIWFILAGVIWQRKKVLTELRKLRITETVFIALFGLVLTVPLIIGALHDTNLLLGILGFPSSLPQIGELGSSALQVPRELFYRGPADATHWVGTMPLLDIFAITMFILGLYTYYNRLKLDRTKLLLLGMILGFILVSIGSTSMSILLPFIYLVVAAGITYLLHEWLGVFPRNPLARGIGTTLLTAAVILSAYYNLNQYFVAWPNAPETKQAFSNPL